MGFSRKWRAAHPITWSRRRGPCALGFVTREAIPRAHLKTGSEASQPVAARDPQALTPLIYQARLLIEEGRSEEAFTLTEEALHARFLPYYAAYDVASVMCALGTKSASLRIPDMNELWRSVADALLEGRLVDVADRLSDLGLKPDEAHARLGAARELVAEGS